ncbi:MAG: SulP family inorganic anion transporter [Bacteriovoracaceae bacterium]
MKLLEDIRPDLSAGFSVALVALPLSIGISLASGAPASAGLIAAIIGGLIGSFLGGSHVTVNGPAAGLIVIVLDAVINLGHGDNVAGFKGMLAAAVVAGAMQIVFALLKLARKGSAFPISVIHGMMAAIGLIIIAKQIHVLFGYTPTAKNPLLLYAEIPSAIMNMNPMVTLIGVISVAFIIVWSKLSWSFTKKIPAPLLTVIIGAALAALLGVTGNSLLNVPADVTSWIIFPDFSVMSTYEGWKAAVTLALVATLETTLSAAAVDKLDPQRRKSDLDKDLLSKGICNMASAAIGGLPMIAEIVRSSANVSFGAKTWRANFTHGLVILIAVLLLPAALNFIPLSALAAILIMVGFRLGNPMHIIRAKKIGWDNLVGFLTTLLVTLGIDLLMGIFLGALAQCLVEIYLGLKVSNLIKPTFSSTNKDSKTVQIKIESALAFSNFLVLKEKIQECLNQNKNLELEFTNCDYIDHSSMENIHDLKKQFEDKGLSITTTFSKKHVPMGSDSLSGLRMTI